MDKLIEKTVELDLEKGFIEVKSKIIVDATHINSMFSHILLREELIRYTKKSVYKIYESMHDKTSIKREAMGLLKI
jgi:hypothetical protein